MTLRLLGAVFLVIIVLGFALQLPAAVIVAFLFFGGCVAIVVAVIIRAINKYW